VPDLTELQGAIVAERQARGFTSDPVRLLTLIVEELGEVARELKGTWSPNYDQPSIDRLAPELADVLVLLAALASNFDIDLAASVEKKFFEDDDLRRWPSAEHP
jgi:NTP pyrophosphatase (non-canonical NTP hydrolase)